MSRAIHATMTLPHKSGFAEDAVVNSFNILVDDDDFVDEWGEITIPLFQFYNVDSPLPTNALGFSLGHGLSRAANAMVCRLYDVTDHLDGSPHGSPVFEDTGTLIAPTSATAMPEECALVITLRSGGWTDYQVEAPDGPDAGVQADRPRQRHSGRIYLGPFTHAAMTLDAGFKCRPTQGLIDSAVQSVKELDVQLQANQHRLSVWSRKDEQFYPLNGPGLDAGAVQVDNAFDTQRRRGPAPTLRTQVLL